MCVWSRYDDDILCWSDIIVMITAGHIRARLTGKLISGLLSPDNTHLISPEIIFKSPLEPIPSHQPVRVHQMLHKYSVRSYKHRLARGTTCLHLSLILRIAAEIYWKWTCNLCISPKYLIIPQINSRPSKFHLSFQE